MSYGTVVMWLSRDFELHLNLKERCGDHSATGQESEDGLFLSPNFDRLNDPSSSLMCTESQFNDSDQMVKAASRDPKSHYRRQFPQIAWLFQTT